MWHTDKEFRALLLALAEGDDSVRPALHDWLVKRGDERALRVIHLAVYECTTKGDSLWYVSTIPPDIMDAANAQHTTRAAAVEQLAGAVLMAFPEGPRWRERRKKFRLYAADHAPAVYITPAKKGLIGPIWPERSDGAHFLRTIDLRD